MPRPTKVTSQILGGVATLIRASTVEEWNKQLKRRYANYDHCSCIAINLPPPPPPQKKKDFRASTGFKPVAAAFALQCYTI